jgi:hypothetical protein
VVHPDPHGWRAVAGKNIVSDPQSEEHGLSEVVDAEHECVPDGLDLRSPEHRQLGSYRITELRHENCGLFVAVCLGERGEAGDVGKHERRGDRGGLTSRIAWRLVRHGDAARSLRRWGVAQPLLG